MSDEIPEASNAASVFIDGFSISSYRSFGEKPQRIGPLKQINLLIGQNNCGKSNILRFLADHYRTAVESARRSRDGLLLKDVDRHLGVDSGRISLGFGLALAGHTPNDLLARHVEPRIAGLCQNVPPSDTARLAALLDKVFRSRALGTQSSVAWFRYESSAGRPLVLSPSLIEDVGQEQIVSPSGWQWLWNILTGRGGGGLSDHWIPETLRLISPVMRQAPEISLIPAVREVGDVESRADDPRGAGLIHRLARMQNPRHDEQEQKSRFGQINDLLRAVTNNQTARLNVPHDRKDIIVEMDGRILPLGSLGTGVHELIILAAEATVRQREVICIEEPELHLHPTQQRRLLRYLRNKTTNQYFITTHSAHLLDAPDAAIFHVRHIDGHSVVEPAITDSQKCGICDDLGYHASDLLQANCLIWVEGPSDRIYLKHWIHEIAPELIEGLHYSIMFYGGRLLNHLSADEEEVEDFIQLRRLNQHAMILIDRDRDGPRAKLNATKQRIRREFDAVGPGFAWITKGREIENYVPPDDLRSAVAKVNPKAASRLKTDLYDKCLQYPIGKNASATVDKVKVARHIAQMPANLERADLRKQLEKLAAFVKKSNELNAPIAGREASVS